jgi:hypothetical protein
VLIRPDGHVAWRARTIEPSFDVIAVLNVVLARSGLPDRSRPLILKAEETQAELLGTGEQPSKLRTFQR